MEDDAREQRLRGRRRLVMFGVYVALWLLTMIGVNSAQPRLFGIPAWYLWAALVIVALVPLNAWFVRRCWPLDAVHEEGESADG